MSVYVQAAGQIGDGEQIAFAVLNIIRNFACFGDLLAKLLLIGQPLSPELVRIIVVADMPLQDCHALSRIGQTAHLDGQRETV